MDNDKVNSVIKYIEGVLYKTGDLRLQNPEILKDIRSRIQRASNIINMSPSDLVLALDFKENDKTIEAVESFLAELRSIFWLDKFGFFEIKPLKRRCDKKPNPDFEAKYNKKNAVVEVFTLTESNEREKDVQLGVFINSSKDFLCKYEKKAKNKKKQLDTIDSDIKILLCVVNQKPISCLNTSDDFKKYLKLISQELKWGNSYHFGILTGIESDDFIYPKLH